MTKLTLDKEGKMSNLKTDSARGCIRTLGVPHFTCNHHIPDVMSKYAPHGGRSTQARATSSTICQKCLGRGHFTYECKNTRPYVTRPSRTQQLENPKLLAKLKAEGKPSVEVPEDFKKPAGTANKILEDKEKERSKDDKGKGKEKEHSRKKSKRKRSGSVSSSSSSDSSDSDSDSSSSSSDSDSSSGSSSGSSRSRERDRKRRVPSRRNRSGSEESRGRKSD